MKIVQDFSDLHIVNNKAIDTATINKLRSLIEPNVSIVIFNGDVFHSFDVGVTNEIFYEFVVELTEKGILVIIVAGNHDVSKGRLSFKIIKHFSKLVKIISEYNYIDFDNYRLHFYNYFRYERSESQFDIHPSKMNILFTHSDLNPESPYASFKPFDFVVNGHIHDFAFKDKYMNLGAVRVVAKNETGTKKYLRFDLDEVGFRYKLVDFESPTKVVELMHTDIDENSVFEVGTDLRVMLPIGNKKDIETKMKSYPWYNPDNITLSITGFKDEVAISDILTKAKLSTEAFNYYELFIKYCDAFKKMFKVEFSNEVMLAEFKKQFANFEKKLNVDRYDIVFDSVASHNFKLFPDFSIKLSDFTGLVSIVGTNNDELGKSGEYSSCESGKTQIKEMILYTLLGKADSGIDPLRWTTKSGWSKLFFKINSVNIYFERKFTNSVSSLIVIENAVDTNGVVTGDDFYPDVTDTEKTELFFKKYNFFSIIKFLFLSNDGQIAYMFSARSQDRFAVLKSLFPVIEYISDFVAESKKNKGLKEGDLKDISYRFKTYSDLRELTARTSWGDWKRLNSDLAQLNLDELNEMMKVQEVKLTALKNTTGFMISKSVTDKLLGLVTEYTISKLVRVELFINQCKWNSVDPINYLNSNIGLSKIQGEIDYAKSQMDTQSEAVILASGVVNNYQPIHAKADLEEHIRLLPIFETIAEVKLTNVAGIKPLSDARDMVSTTIVIRASELNQIEKQKELLLTEYKKKKLDMLRVTESSDSITCSECGTVLDTKEKKELHIQQLETELTDLVSMGTNLKKSIEGISKNIVELTAERDGYISKISDIYGIFSKNNISESLVLSYWNSMLKLTITHKEATDDLATHELFNKANADLISATRIFSNLEDEYKKLLARNEAYKVMADKKITTDVNQEEYLAYRSSIDTLVSLAIPIKEELPAMLSEYSDYLVKKELIDSEIGKINASLSAVEATHNRLKLDKKRIFEVVKNGNKSGEFRTLKLDYEVKKSDSELATFFYDLLNSKQKISFEKFFVNTLFKGMETVFNTFLGYLFTRDVTFVVNDMNFEFIDAQNPSGYKSFSGGGKTKVEFAFIITWIMMWMENGNTSNLIFFDEYLDTGIEDVNGERIIKVLKDIDINCKYVITHKGILDEYKDRVINIERSNGVSKLI